MNDAGLVRAVQRERDVPEVADGFFSRERALAEQALPEVLALEELHYQVRRLGAPSSTPASRTSTMYSLPI